jgi:hypothetical protein
MLTTHTQTSKKQEKNTFNQRNETLSNIPFTDAEVQLLNKGLKYNLH